MGFDHCDPHRPRAPELTEREREVLRRITHGQSTRQIAKGLAITPSTARTHAHNVLLKLGVHSRVQAVAHAVQTPAPPPAPVPEPCEANPLGTLTQREHEVLSCMIEGLTRAAIAERLRLSPHTVRTHARNVLAKLGVHSTLEAAALVRASPDRANRRPVNRPD